VNAPKADKVEQPVPYIVGLDNAGVLTIGFTKKMQVPANLTANLTRIKDEEVALRKLAARTETYLTESGYRDFDIRPALELEVIPSGASEPHKLDFEWELIEFLAN